MPRGWVTVTGSHGGLAAKLEDERESFLALVSKTRTKLLKAFPLHEVPDRVDNCRNAFFWMQQHLHGTGVAKCLQDLEIALDILTAINLTDLDAAPDRRIVTGLSCECKALNAVSPTIPSKSFFMLKSSWHFSCK